MNTYEADQFIAALDNIRRSAISDDDLAAYERGRAEYETIPAMARDEDAAWYDRAEEEREHVN